jgi:nucleotide-binding universal stress UspA family protein
MYQKIGVAVAFSPRCEAIIGESARLQGLFNAELVIIHVGEKHEDEAQFLEEMIDDTGIDRKRMKVVWEQGSPASKILSICNREKVDLLVAGALQKENLLKYYIGSIARRLIRRSHCSVLMLINPSFPSSPFKNIVINGTEGENYYKSIRRGIGLARMEGAQFVHIFKAIKLFGLSMAIAGEEESEHEYEATRRQIVNEEIKEIEDLLDSINTEGLRVNIKVAAGKAGFELSKFARRKSADLLIVQGPSHKLGVFDRLFPHYLESVMEDLPSNILIDKA